MRKMISLCAVILLTGNAFAQAPTGVNLAQLEGWDIVLAADATPSERYAAEELRDHLAKGGAPRLEITDKGSRPDRHFFIGGSDALRASPAGFSTDAFGPEDLRIIVRDGNIAIAGGRPRGTLYGVYTFLEDYAGVRFLTADHTHVPPLAPWRVVAPVDRFYHPPLSFRWCYYGETNNNPVFAARLRCNTISDDPKLGGKTGTILINHTLGAQIPSKQYAKEHPEYFAFIDGKRLASVGDEWFGTQPCLTNPDVLKIVTAAVLDELKKNPQRENISVSQNDNDKYCRCPNCAAIDAREETPMGSLLTFVNAIADEVAKQYPKVKVGTLSYWYTRKPPKTLRPRSNVQIQLCSIECCDVHPIADPNCPKNRQFCADVENWGKICSEISIWNYNTNFANYLLPFPNLRVIEPNVRYFVANHAHGVFMQAAGNAMSAELSDLRNYVMARLLWDPNGSGPRIGHEFIDLHYGKAAVPIRKFIRVVHDRAEQSGKHPNCYGGNAAYGINDAVIESGLKCYAEALRLADNDVVRARVEKASIAAYRAAIEPAWLAMDNGKIDPAEKERLRPLVKTFLELTKKYGVTMATEGMPMPEAAKRLKALYGIPTTQEF